MNYLTKTAYRSQKARLTRAKNTGNPLVILDAVEKTLDEWEGVAWPDDWNRWSVALDDAYFAWTRSADRPLSIGTDVRFRAAFDRFHR